MWSVECKVGVGIHLSPANKPRGMRGWKPSTIVPIPDARVGYRI